MNKKHNSLILIFFCLLIIFLTSDYAFSADKQLYLITGTPTPKSDTLFPVLLCKIDELKKNITSIAEIVSKDKGVELIRYNYEKRIVIIETKSGRTEDGFIVREFSMIDMNDSQKQKSFEMNYRQFLSIVEVHLFDIPNKGLFLGIEVFHKGNGIIQGLNLTTMKQEELQWDVYKYTIPSGIPGGAMPGDWISLYANTDGRLMIPTIIGRIQSDWQLPSSIKFDEKDRIVLFVNNDEILALSSIESRVKKTAGIGHSTFHIFNKKTVKWNSVQFAGGNTAVRGFGLWLAGLVTGEKQNEDIPGKNKWRKDMTSTGTPVEWRFKDFGIFSTGILFLYNTETQQKYEIETNQGDSEILLVEDDTVYYRVYDEIYQAKIGMNKIETGTLLVKDDVVPDIHWAFLAAQ